MEDKLKEMLCRQIVIFDGAMGTEIYRHNFFVNNSFEGLCLSSPDTISEIHKSYVDAGANVLTTNTYSANFNKLARFGLGEKLCEINEAAVLLARKAAGENVLVAASVGPVGELSIELEDYRGKSVAMLAEQIAVLEKAGADFIIFETLSSVQDTEFACAAISSGSNLPYVLSFSLDRNAETAKGETLGALLNVCAGAARPPTALGLNCGEGPEGMLNTLELLRSQVDYPIIVQPNAGVPKNVDGRMIYMSSPEYLTTYALRYVNLGARGVGGCCGTGPEHIRDMARSVRPFAKSEFSSSIKIKEPELPLKEPMPMAEKSAFAAKLAKREWVTSVEIVPPRGYQLAQTIEKARQCKAAGVDAINLPDGPRASSRISPLITALKMQEEAGIEAVLHICCRDKNLIGMQADLLGCAAVGIRNILFITGDPPKLGDYPFASAVFDVDSIGMARIQDRMNRGVDVGGKPIDPPTCALIGVGADPNAVDMQRELRRLREKAEAGAEFIITQPVFAVEPLLRFLDEIEDLKMPVLAGIWPLASYSNAEFMKNEVPGVIVPDEVMRRMAQASGKEAQRQEGIKIAKESVAQLRGKICGVQVSAPFGNVATALAVLAP
ncbi:MAG: bifunctional homocysteine S-methyltransferase/methylenetetrahydrofolate reductase [Lentisphaerae bacterium GWF2_52_8]|nr:MAG: bifunctional homocysteine S-methyltransferase/methylenetetrahydrofolate reductase [Lentisphaerae bacterium GWF2_52_8]